MSSEERAVWTAAFGSAFAQMQVPRVLHKGIEVAHEFANDMTETCRRIADAAVRSFMRSGRAG